MKIGIILGVGIAVGLRNGGADGILRSSSASTLSRTIHFTGNRYLMQLTAFAHSGRDELCA